MQNPSKPFFLLLLTFFLCWKLGAQDLNISEGLVFEGEPYMAINPTNPQHIVVAWMGWVLSNRISIKSKVSFDGGANWSNESIIPHEFLGATSADPSIEFDKLGNVFLCYVDYNVLENLGAVFIRKSTDGGMSWGMPVEVINIDDDGDNKPADRPWMKIDRSSGVNSGNIYVTTMPPAIFGFIPPPRHPYVTRSVDGGNSFEPWRYLDTVNWLAGSLIPQPTPFPTISKNGTFHAVYPSFLITQSPDAQYIMASTYDGGNSFSHSLITAQPSSATVTDQDAKKGFPLIADPSDDNHLVFLNLLNVNGDADVFMWESFDGGTSWSNPIRLNDDPIGNNRMQDLIWADFNNDGDLIVTWRDRRNGLDSTYATASEIWGAVRLDDSLDFSPNFRLSDTIALYDPVLASGGNDFMCVDLVNDTINAVWGDTRNGTLKIWFKKLSIEGTVVSVNQISSEELIKIDIFPNPFNSVISIKGQDLKSIVVLNQKGEVVLRKENTLSRNEREIDLSHVSNGIYFLEVTTEKGIITKKVIKQ